MATTIKPLHDRVIVRRLEAISEFEKLYIQKALARYDEHLSQTANALGIHRNTLSKRVTAYQTPAKTPKRLLVKRSR